MEAASVPHATGVSAGPAASTVRLAPIDRSWNPLVWFAMAVYSSIGTTQPIRVIFARAPRLILAHIILMISYAYGTSLAPRLRALVSVFGSRVNGCMFCDDLETRMALKHKAISREDIDALADYSTSDRFSPRERAALRYVEELNTTRRAGDETFSALRPHFSEREIVELTWINAVGNYLNLQARPLGLVPEGACGIPAGEKRG